MRGEVVLLDGERTNRSCNFRVLIGSDGRDRGLGREALELLLPRRGAVQLVGAPFVT